jgi:hypothetical protein
LSEAAETEAPERVLLWSGYASMYALPDGGRLVCYTREGAEDERVPIPAEIVPMLDMLARDPNLLLNLSTSPVGGIARRMAGQFVKKVEKAEAAAANGG